MDITPPKRKHVKGGWTPPQQLQLLQNSWRHLQVDLKTGGKPVRELEKVTLQGGDGIRWKTWSVSKQKRKSTKKNMDASLASFLDRCFKPE